MSYFPPKRAGSTVPISQKGVSVLKFELIIFFYVLLLYLFGNYYIYLFTNPNLDWTPSKKLRKAFLFLPEVVLKRFLIVYLSKNDYL